MAVEVLGNTPVSTNQRNRVYAILTGSRPILSAQHSPSRCDLKFIAEGSFERLNNIFHFLFLFLFRFSLNHFLMLLDEEKPSIDGLPTDRIVQQMITSLITAAKPYIDAFVNTADTTLTVLPREATPTEYSNVSPPQPQQAQQAPPPEPSSSLPTEPPLSPHAPVASPDPAVLEGQPPPHTAIAPPGSSAPPDNWLAPFLRAEGMTDNRIVQECCDFIVGKQEFTKECFAGLSQNEFNAHIGQYIAVPGRLATVKCANNKLNHLCKQSMQVASRDGELEDQMSELSMNAGPAHATLYGQSVGPASVLQSASAAVPIASLSSAANDVVTTGDTSICRDIVHNQVCAPLPTQTGAVSTASFPVTCARNPATPHLTTADDVGKTATAGAIVSNPIMAALLPAPLSTSPMAPHVCHRGCSCSPNTVGRKYKRAITPVKVGAGDSVQAPVGSRYTFFSLETLVQEGRNKATRTASVESTAKRKR